MLLTDQLFTQKLLSSLFGSDLLIFTDKTALSKAELAALKAGPDDVDHRLRQPAQGKHRRRQRQSGLPRVRPRLESSRYVRGYLDMLQWERLQIGNTRLH